MAFKWEDYFETGIAIIDEQHKGLVDIINEAAPLLTSKGETARGRLEVLLERLFEYAATHFKTEEDLARRHGLLESYLAHHHGVHESFVGQLIELRTSMGSSQGEETGPALLRFLTGWLTFHILDEDQRMARQMQFIGAGESAQSAFEKSAGVSRNDLARAALVAALLDLYSVVGERNRTLHATNEKLLNLSRHLEARVAERTAELKQTLEKMERTQSQLLQSEKMAAIGQLAAGVAHEINNPIGFVNSNLGTLKSYVPQLLGIIDAAAVALAQVPDGNEGKNRYLEATRRADLDYLRKDITDLIGESTEGLDRVKRIVQDLKDFSHVDEAEWQDADLNAGLDSTLNVVANELKYKADVVRQYGDLPKVRCVAAQLNQVFMNLLVNAAQSIEGRGTITLTTRASGDGVQVEVRDTGKGMSEEVQGRIFEPFFTTKPVGKGTGLGLSIAWDIIVKKHGGRLSVVSAPGQGACFRIELPLAPESKTADNLQGK